MYVCVCVLVFASECKSMFLRVCLSAHTQTQIDPRDPQTYTLIHTHTNKQKKSGDEKSLYKNSLVTKSRGDEKSWRRKVG